MLFKRKVAFNVFILVGIICVLGYAQKVSFEAPMQWLSYRSDTIKVKVHVDTANIKEKRLELTLSKHENMKKSKIASTTIKITNFTHEFVFKPLGKTMFGGRDFLSLEWSIPKGEDKGRVAPFGILNIQKNDYGDTFFVRKSAEPLNMANITSIIKEENFHKTGSSVYAAAWNNKSLQFVCRKNNSKKCLVFCFDVKNAKSAFGSYPDRFVSFIPSNDTLTKDSLKTYFNTREFKNDSIIYTEKSWNGEMSIESNTNYALITIPMHDLGFLPFDGRCLGFAVLELDDKNNIVAAFPKKAVQLIPGSWGNLVLKE